MEKTLKPFSISLLLMYLHLNTGNAELITVPQNTEVLVNHSTYFNCSTSVVSEQIHWYHYPVGEGKMNYVYYKGQFNKIYSDRYSVAIDAGTGKYDLIIRFVQPGDAGRYVCQDDGGLGSQRSAELIVLDHGPVCQSSMTPGGLTGPNSCDLSIDELELSCSASYSGNIRPTLQWKKDGSDTPISDGITIDNSMKILTVNLTKSPEVELNQASFTCGTTGSHGSILSCTSGLVEINYAIQNPEILNVTKGETVTCSANASVPCIYRWFYGNDTLCPESCNHVLTTSRLGNHSCEASCTIDGISCTFVAMRIFVYENETMAVSEDTREKLLLAILIPTIVILLITTCIMFFMIRKATAKNADLTREVSNMHETLCIISQAQANRVISNDVFQPRENHPEGLRIRNEMRPLLGKEDNALQGDKNIIETDTKEEAITTKASKEMGRAITGVAILEDLIYIVSDKSSEVETFDSESFEFKNRCKLEELENPCDMASCKLNKCLYIMDRPLASRSNHVIRVNSHIKALVQWSTGEEYGNLSVASEGHVVVTFCYSRRLVIYESDGTRLNVVSLSEDILHPLHALKLSNGQFLISHGLNKDNVQRVCVLDKNGEIIQNSFERMETPSYLAVDIDGMVFVADQGNRRVCALNSDLELTGEVVSQKHGLRSPQKVCLDKRNGKLLVGDNELLEFKQRGGKLMIFNYDQK